jgi:hypothetical protein
MTDPTPERRGDPRTLSRKHPGRSKIQDDPPPLTPYESSKKKSEEQRERTQDDPVPDPSTVEVREARAYSAMPYGRKGSRKRKPPAEGSNP